ncbi:MAG: DUF349 domain-containing protein [Gammaproteobacteria bacterium]
MFDRLLGPRTDHADPKVRAKAFGHDSIDQATLNEALKKEIDPDVLCVIIGRADDVPSVLAHAQSSGGSIANEARTRLVALAKSDSNTSSDDWARVYSAAYGGSWSQTQALNDLLAATAGREHVVQGALVAQPEPALLPESVLLSLATHSSSSAVRRSSASKLHSKDMLEKCCVELKEKDKTVYREVKERVDAFKREEERKALALELISDCRKLNDMQVIAQPESVAVAQARRQSLDQKAKALNDEDATIGGPVLEELGKAAAIFDTTLETARGLVSKRREIKHELVTLKESLSENSEGVLEGGPEKLAELESVWKKISDHSDSEVSHFERNIGEIAALFNAQQNEKAVHDRLSKRIEQWEGKAESVAPEKLLSEVSKEWQSCEKPKGEELVASLQQRVSALTSSLETKQKALAHKRSANSEQLLKILEEFNQTMEKGEFKKAMSLNDKLKARSANRELEPAARKRIEDTLKSAQPKLEEFRKWRHFGTQQARENLVGQANTLISDPPASPKALSVAVKGLREAWRKLDQDDGRASESSWQVFSKACKEAYKPAKKHFDQLAKERKSNLGVKKGLLQELETLLSDTNWDAPDWDAVVKTHKDLIAQWRRSGTVDHKVKKELEASYASVDKRLQEQFKEERDSEMLRRRRLIDQLKAQKETETGGKLASAAKKAQREWRPTVQGDRKTEQALWQEFRGVCDDIFGSLKEQQKEAKVAWQAEVAEREAMCAQVDALLVDESESGAESYDTAAANQATGKLKELAGSWRERHQIPSGIAGKLDSRFKEARRNAEARIARVVKKEEKRNEEKLDVLLNVCQRADEALLSGDFDVEQFASKSDEFSTLRGVAGKGLSKRFEQTLRAMNGDSKAVEQIQQAVSDNLNTRTQLCLLGELVADVDSPPHAQSDRMALKMKRLTEAMQGELESPEKELAGIVNRWFSVGGVEAEHWSELNARFTKIRAASV